MFGRNEIVGRKSFPDMDKLLVTSIFVTMQGEGPYSGLPAVFVRLAKCNLACSFCDTYFDSGDWFTFDELDARIDEEIFGAGMLEKRDYVLIITGGEPMLQQALAPWLDTQFRDGKSWRNIQIETNGTQFLTIDSRVTLVVSPKCREKAHRAVAYLKPNHLVIERADALKFVMEADESSPYSTIPDWAFDWKRETGGDIFVSPINVYNRAPQQAKVDRLTNRTTLEQRSKIEEVISFWEPGLLNLEANERNHVYTAKYAVRTGCRFQVQAHLYAGLA
ncbi:MAG TPA: 7-carboxy-7-deazaguanine synthase QueE [Acidimicrobiia bacterium]